jgi:hypothetical protein
MGWSIAQAKQRLSEVVRLSAREPQPLYNRGRLVGALIDAESYAAFERWRQGAAQATVADEFEALRAQLAAQAPRAGEAEASIAVASRSDRPNAFSAMLDDEFAPPSPAPDDAAG